MRKRCSKCFAYGGNVAVRDSEYGASAWSGSRETTLTVDLERLPRADATAADLVLHHREQAKYHAEEAARLTQDDVDSRQAAFEWHESRQSWHAERTLELETACSTVKAQRGDAEMVQLRRECERMCAVVDAAIEWMSGPLSNDKHDVPLMIAVDAYRKERP